MSPSNPQVATLNAEDVLNAVEAPLYALVRLLIARGATLPMLEALLERLYIRAALAWFVDPEDRFSASQLYMLTGIHRKKIPALLQNLEERPRPSRSTAMQVLDAITGDPALLAEDGFPRPLPITRREGGEHSFEAVVARVSTDVRPRAVLDQWLKSGVAELDEAGRVVVARGRPTTYPPGHEVAMLDRLLEPAAQALVDKLLGLGGLSSNALVKVEGLPQEQARQLAVAARDEIRRVLLRLNHAAERAARAAQEADAAAAAAAPTTTLVLGSFEWVAAAQPVAEPAEGGAPAQRPHPALRRRPRRTRPATPG